jgi:hypothetical protein
VAIEKSQKKCPDMCTIDIRVSKENDFGVPQTVQVESVSDP